MNALEYAPNSLASAVWQLEAFAAFDILCIYLIRVKEKDFPS